MREPALSKFRNILIASATALTAAGATALAQTASIHVPAQPLSQSLKDVAHQTGENILFSPEAVQGIEAHSVDGSMSVRDAVEKLLAGTNLEAVSDGNGGLVVRPKNVQAAASGDAAATSSSIETVTVTGSRIPTQIGNTAHDVKVYDRKHIEQSGQSSVSDFLNTLPSVSTNSTDSFVQQAVQGTTVTLRGMPVGTTLVLLNGRRLETSGSQFIGNFFDLNNIPLAAVDRIEVLADGSSAIYGSDAIAGVVNIILKKNFDGLDANVQYGGARNIGETDASLSAGTTWGRASLSILGSYQTHDALTTDDRAITRSNDFTRFGGPDNNYPLCFPGNVFSTDGSTLPGAPAGSNASYAEISGSTKSGRPNLSDFNYGTLNECALFAGASIIPKIDRYGILASSSYQLTASTELFAELLYSHQNLYQSLGPQKLFGIPGFQSFTVSAANPYNPFDITIGIAAVIPAIQEIFSQNTDFVRGLIGARGELWGDWTWEISGWDSHDWTYLRNRNEDMDVAGFQNALNSTDPTSALNPFVAGALGPRSYVQTFFTDEKQDAAGEDLSINGFARGTLLNLESGPIQAVVGGETDRSSIRFHIIETAFPPPLLLESYDRTSYAAFTEARLPILSGPTEGSERLALTAAGRLDHFSDFGTKTTGQLAAEWRPLAGLLVRATYADAFKAPPLRLLHQPQDQASYFITDPQTGQTLEVPATLGGNPSLQPITGTSRTVGFVWNGLIPDLSLSATNWDIEEDNDVQQLSPQFIVDNESSFPGRVIRDENGNITRVIATPVNFGQIKVAGIDYSASYRFETDWGAFSTAANFTQIYRYDSALTPGAPIIKAVSKAQDSGDWAPRWKGTVSLDYSIPSLTAHFDERYVGSYRDYDSPHRIGDFWIADLSIRLQLGQVLDSQQKTVAGSYLVVGAVNLFDQQPQFSNYGFDFLGYDPTQADIRGRFIYARLGTSW